MTRDELEKLENQWSTFTGEFVKYGRIKRQTYTTVLLKNICHNGVKVADHVWFTFTKEFSNIYEGEIVKFNAHVGWYQRGYVGGNLRYRGVDFMLSCPTNIEVIEARMIITDGSKAGVGV
jgi:hypothetical protein